MPCTQVQRPPHFFFQSERGVGGGGQIPLGGNGRQNKLGKLSKVSLFPPRLLRNEIGFLLFIFFLRLCIWLAGLSRLPVAAVAGILVGMAVGTAVDLPRGMWPRCWGCSTFSFGAWRSFPPFSKLSAFFAFYLSVNLKRHRDLFPCELHRLGVPLGWLALTPESCRQIDIGCQSLILNVA